MYAELLEMRDADDTTWGSPSRAEDGLPKDLEREWVALAPVPKGKRCIAVSFAPSVSGPDVDREHQIVSILSLGIVDSLIINSIVGLASKHCTSLPCQRTGIHAISSAVAS